MSEFIDKLTFRGFGSECFGQTRSPHACTCGCCIVVHPLDQLFDTGSGPKLFHQLSPRQGTAKGMLNQEQNYAFEPVFVFDLDRTLVDSVYEHVLAWKEVLEPRPRVA